MGKLIGSFKQTSDNTSELTDSLITEFNTQKKLGGFNATMVYKDIHITAVYIPERQDIYYFGVIIFEYEDGVSIESRKQQKFIDMPPGVDPNDPTTWPEGYLINAPTRAQEGS